MSFPSFHLDCSPLNVTNHYKPSSFHVVPRKPLITFCLFPSQWQVPQTKLKAELCVVPGGRQCSYLLSYHTATYLLRIRRGWTSRIYLESWGKNPDYQLGCAGVLTRVPASRLTLFHCDTLDIYYIVSTSASQSWNKHLIIIIFLWVCPLRPSPNAS